MQHLTDSLVGLFSFLCCIFWSNTNLKILPMDIFEAFGQYENHFFGPIDLKFGIYI